MSTPPFSLKITPPCVRKQACLATDYPLSFPGFHPTVATMTRPARVKPNGDPPAPHWRVLSNQPISQMAFRGGHPSETHQPFGPSHLTSWSKRGTGHGLMHVPMKFTKEAEASHWHVRWGYGHDVTMVPCSFPGWYSAGYDTPGPVTPAVEGRADTARDSICHRH
eukprot:766618-Hanusia_phi.AAC.13